MKKNRYILFLFLFPLVFTACGDDVIIRDFINTSILIQVEDAQGNDLLDPAYERNITNNEIKVLYHDKEYLKDADVDKFRPQTRFNMPRWYGLCSYEKDGEYYLAFGEFAPEDGYKKEYFTIDWGDGTKDEIGFDCYITWKKKKPKVHDGLYLNGKKVERIIIVK